MFKTLRKKFIAVTMLSTTLVLAVIIGGINVFNYVSISRSADQLMSLLEEGGGKFPENMDIRPPNFEHRTQRTDSFSKPGDTSQPPAKPSGSYQKEKTGGLLFLKRPSLPAEAAYKTRYFTVTLTPGGTVYATDTGHIHATSSDQAQRYALELFSDNKTDGFINHYKYRRIQKDENGTLRYIYIFLDCEEDFLTFTDFLVSSLFFSLIGLLVVFLLVMILSKKVLKPVAESYAKQKRFITDASHEIKTPLTIIDANTEIIEMTGEESEWTASIRNQVKRLADLTEKLVFLSRMDEGGSIFNMVDFSMTDAVKETLEPFDAVASTKGIAIRPDIAPGVSFHGDEGYIRQMISLLTDNALKYVSSPGEIRITLKSTGHGCRFTIWNSVDEIEAGSHDELFDRFYRRDASRNSKTGGHGIGLSVVQAIVQAHKGKISCRSEDTHSILFTVSL